MAPISGNEMGGLVSNFAGREVVFNEKPSPETQGDYESPFEQAFSRLVGESTPILAEKSPPVGRYTHILKWQSQEGAHLRGY